MSDRWSGWRPYWHEEDGRLVAYKPAREFDQMIIGGWRGHPRSEKSIARALKKCQKLCDRKNAAEDRIRNALADRDTQPKGTT